MICPNLETEHARWLAARQAGGGPSTGGDPVAEEGSIERPDPGAIIGPPHRPGGRNRGV